MVQDRGSYAVITADDFGKSPLVNRAIAEAHDRGIVTAASIMVGGKAFEEAVRIAQSRSRLSVGLHVTLCNGLSVLSHAEIPDLVDYHGYFETSPSRAWLKYSRDSILSQVENEIEAQFDLLAKARINPTHVDGHHHLHMHPALFKIICRKAAQRGVPWIRIPCEPLSLVFRSFSTSRGAMPFVAWGVFRILKMTHERTSRYYGLHVANAVYGLSRSGQVDEKYLSHILTRSVHCIEIFTHPEMASEAGSRELEALVSPAVKDKLASHGIALRGFRDIPIEAVIKHVEAESL
jgi:hopanoid biosynthesis associated protein HpnK